MKKLLLVAGLMLASVAAYAQGTLNFASFVTVPAPGTSVNAPVFNSDGTTRLAGASFMAILYAGPTAGSMQAVGTAVAFSTGGGAGYFIGGTRTVTTVAGNAIAFLQVRAWDTAAGATWDAAFASGSRYGMSPILQLTLGQAPATPPNMTGLQGFNLVPEPSTIALGILGASALLFRRRK